MRPPGRMRNGPRANLPPARRRHSPALGAAQSVRRLRRAPRACRTAGSSFARFLLVSWPLARLQFRAPPNLLLPAGSCRRRRRRLVSLRLARREWRRPDLWPRPICNHHLVHIPRRSPLAARISARRRALAGRAQITRRLAEVEIDYWPAGPIWRPLARRPLWAILIKSRLGSARAADNGAPCRASSKAGSNSICLICLLPAQ